MKVAYVTHDPARGEPVITCWFCALEIEVFATDHAMSVTDPKSRLWRHVATLDQHLRPAASVPATARPRSRTSFMITFGFASTR